VLLLNDSMEHKCSMCPYLSSYFEDFCDHLFKRHYNAPSIIIHCSICGASFRNKLSFRSHYYRKHFRDLNGQTVENDEVVGDSHGELNADELDNELTGAVNCSEATFLLKLKAGHRLSQSAVADVLSATKELFVSKIRQLQSEWQYNGLPSLNDNMTTVFADNMFNGLETEHLQLKAFEQQLGYIKPVQVELGSVRQNVVSGGKYVVKNQMVCGYIVPFMKQLVQLLAMPEVNRSVGYFCAEGCGDGSEMTAVHDGTRFRSDPFFQEHSNALRFGLYTDEFEIVNPIGSHRRKHKITAVYWTLLNIPVEQHSKLRVIQLYAIAKSKFLKQFGLCELLKDLCDSLNALYQGVDLDIPRYGSRRYFGKLCFVLADTLAAHSLGGFKEGVGGAKKPCRTCEVSRTAMASVHFAGECQLRDEKEHWDRVEMLATISKPARQYWSKEWGITGSTVLASVPDFQVTKMLLHDPMHDILEGVARYEVRAMLHLFIVSRKLFSLEELNSRIQNFEYSYSERKDKPQLLDKQSLEPGSTLGQSAASMKTFMTLLPCLIGDRVPVGDCHWVNFLRLLQILLLSLSPVVSEKTIQNLEMLVAVHNAEFCKLYENESFRPKLHYLVHYPDQMINFGPLRNHWCMRLESKNGFFKQKRWYNFRNLPLSLATYHQQWMCLQMSGIDGRPSETYLYEGDEVKEGCVVNSGTVALLQEQVGQCTALQTDLVVIHGHRYCIGAIILMELTDEPVFGEIVSIFNVCNEKFFECEQLSIIAFDNHMNMFSVKRSGKRCMMKATDMRYKWTQIHHKICDENMVMLVNCGDVITISIAWHSTICI